MPGMKAFLYAQLNPVKTLRQLVQDRELCRLMAIGAVLCALWQ